MSVLLETSLGDIVIDLEVDACPKTCENFLKLCKVYYYNLHAFFNGAPAYSIYKTLLLTPMQFQKTFSPKWVTQRQQVLVASRYGHI